MLFSPLGAQPLGFAPWQPFGVYPWQAYLQPGDGHQSTPGMHRVAAPTVTLGRVEPSATHSAVPEPIGGVYSLGGSIESHLIPPPSLHDGEGSSFPGLQHLCHVIQSDMLSVYHSPTQLFSHVHFSPSSLCQLEQLAKLQQSPVPLQFPLPDVVIATDATPTHWAFYFQGSGLSLSVSGAWSGSLSRAHIALQKLQAVAVMLRRMAFHLSGKVVALHLDNSTAKAYLCNQGGTVSPFLSRLACHILSLTNKHGITLLPAYIPTHLNVEADFLSWDWAASRVAPSTSGGSGSFLPLGPSRGGPPGIFSFYSMPALFHFGNSTASGSLGVECLQPSLEFSGKLCVSSSGSGPSCFGQVSSRTCQQSTQTFASGGSMLDGSSLASYSSQHTGRHSSAVSHCKRSHHGCFGRPGTQGSAISAFNPLAAQRCVLYRQGFSSSVCQAVAGAT